MAGGKFSEALLNGMTIRESANDGSDFTNPAADYRRLFLGEDAQLHVKDSAGTVTGIGGSISEITDIPTAETDTDLRLAPDGVGGVEWSTGGGGGDYSASSTLTASGGSYASFDFTSIPGTHRHLVIDVMARGDKAAAFDDLYLRINNDSGANYDWQSLGAYATTVFGVEAIAAAQVTLGQPSAASGVASTWSHYAIKISNYAATGFHKVVNAQAAEKTAASSTGIVSRQTVAFWRSTAAITRVTIFFAGGNVEDASVATLHLISS